MMDRETRLKRLRFRAWHRGTREADFMIGGFFDRYHADWNDAELQWYERLMAEEDVDIMGWAIGTIARSEEHTSELQSLMRISYAVFCLKKKNRQTIIQTPRLTTPTPTAQTQHAPMCRPPDT